MGFVDSITNSIKKPLGAKPKTPEELYGENLPTHIIDAIKPVEKYVPYSGIIIKGAEALASKQN